MLPSQQPNNSQKHSSTTQAPLPLYPQLHNVFPSNPNPNRNLSRRVLPPHHPMPLLPPQNQLPLQTHLPQRLPLLRVLQVRRPLGLLPRQRSNHYRIRRRHHPRLHPLGRRAYRSPSLSAVQPLRVCDVLVAVEGRSKDAVDGCEFPAGGLEAYRRDSPTDGDEGVE